MKGLMDKIIRRALPVMRFLLKPVLSQLPMAMTDRPYRKALDKETALKEIQRNASKQFHPDLTKKFVAMLGKTTGKQN